MSRVHSVQAPQSESVHTAELSPTAALDEILTIRSTIQPNVTMVAIRDAEGLVGLGETFYGATSVEAHVHDVAAGILRDADIVSPARIAADLADYVGFSGSGAEVRGNSAIDIALWDLRAKQAGVPLRDLLGGPFTASIPIYNTCSGNFYVNAESRQSSSNWGIGLAAPDAPHEDLWAFLNRPGDLARELVDQGYRGMKVWPFDMAAEESAGTHRADLAFGLRVLDEIRDAVGDAIELYVELHSLWQLGGAERVLRALERFDLVWAEDPIRADRTGSLARLKQASSVPIAVGEASGAGYDSYLPLLEKGAIDVAILDMGWGGGITAGLRAAALADSFGVPVALHDCTGPISLATATHLATTLPNSIVQEVSRAFYHGWYQTMVTGLPEISQGSISPASAPGHGVVLREDFLTAPTTQIRSTRLR